jgi:hypothetical protein
LFICCAIVKSTVANKNAKLEARRQRIEILPLESADDFVARKSWRDFRRAGVRRAGAVD